MTIELDLAPHSLGVVLPVKAQPGAKRNAILGVRQGALRVAVTAPPDKGKANAALAETLAQALHLPKSKIQLLMGETSRDKRFLAEGLTAEELLVRLSASVPTMADKA